MIPYGRQEVTEEDIAEVVRVLRSDFLTQGPEVPRFEDAISAFCGAKHAVAVSSGTAALHVACMALGVGPDDEVWTSPITFVASANCAQYCGARVDFVDIDPATRNMSVAALEEKLAQAARAGRLPKAVVVVHFAGRSAEMREIARLCRRYGVRVIEDAAHALGGEYDGAKVGACRYSDITTFSLHPVKIITAAEGGLALTNDADLAERMRMLRTHGITRDRALLKHDDGPWYYEQQMLGFNYRMPDVLAALGRSQLRRLERYVRRRAELAERYHEMLAGLPLKLPVPDDEAHRSAWHLYAIELDLKKAPIDRKALFEGMRAAGFGVQVHYIPVHLQPWYRRQGFGPGHCPAAEAYYEAALSLPLYPTLPEDAQEKVVATLSRLLA